MQEITTLKRLLGLAAAVAMLAGCSAGSSPASLPGPAMPASTSPGSVAAAPMAKTEPQPASVMNARTPASTISGLAWTQVPGSASSVVGAPDGSMWALSDQPAGPDKYIWHYAGGSWTNIGGLASQLAVAPNGTLYAINSGGGTYAYSAGAWMGLGGGAVGVAAVADNSVYVLSNDGNADHAIWHYASGNWTQVPGSGVAIVGSVDTASHALAGGTVVPGGYYLTNSVGAIYYGNANGSYVSLPGNAAGIAPAVGGLFALGYPANPSGEQVYYFDLDGQHWSAQSGSGVGVADAASTLYVVGANGGIYSSAAPTSTWPCSDNQFNTDQAAYANGTLKVSYIEEDVCGVVTTVLPSKTTSSGLHGYYYLQLPSGYQIEIVCNLNAMKNAPPVWPWVKTGDYSYVQGRYYYDNASSQGIDWTENDTGSWPTVGWVVINGNKYN